eukprot:TRINITY_DN3697_c0_g1_i9.p1 TRINITY_DN3697_c0_g1~~TRINITY_DN3697_c0_g1_i9.p1  ORF type:complete len:314 (+),score=36.00 TRINITY_DN3697_c0_g1_i9:755-1696(+)
MFVIVVEGCYPFSGFGKFLFIFIMPFRYRFTTAVFPSADDDVITSPYNSILALSKLIEHSDCVLPVENQALLDICTTKMAGTRPERGAVEKSTKPFDSMNGLVAHLLLNLTSGMRFEGSLNVDLNEITMNLVPFPMLHFIVPSLSPLSAVTNSRMPPRRLDQMFSDVFSRDSQLIKADPKNNRYLACGLMLRGAVELSDVRKNIDKIKPNLDFVHWNPEGWKVGMCSVPSVNQPYSLLCLANNCCFKDTIGEMTRRFRKLYNVRAHVWHYTEYMDEMVFQESIQTVDNLWSEYDALGSSRGSGAGVKRMIPLA